MLWPRRTSESQTSLFEVLRSRTISPLEREDSTLHIADYMERFSRQSSERTLS